MVNLAMPKVRGKRMRSKCGRDEQIRHMMLFCIGRHQCNHCLSPSTIIEVCVAPMGDMLLLFENIGYLILQRAATNTVNNSKLLATIVQPGIDLLQYHRFNFIGIFTANIDDRRKRTVRRNDVHRR